MKKFKMETLSNRTVDVDRTASAYVGLDIVSKEIISYFIEMDEHEYEVDKIVFDAVVKEFGLSYDDE